MPVSTSLSLTFHVGFSVAFPPQIHLGVIYPKPLPTPAVVYSPVLWAGAPTRGTLNLPTRDLSRPCFFSNYRLKPLYNHHVIPHNPPYERIANKTAKDPQTRQAPQPEKNKLRRENGIICIATEGTEEDNSKFKHLQRENQDVDRK